MSQSKTVHLPILPILSTHSYDLSSTSTEFSVLSCSTWILFDYIYSLMMRTGGRNWQDSFGSRNSKCKQFLVLSLARGRKCPWVSSSSRVEMLEGSGPLVLPSPYLFLVPNKHPCLEVACGGMTETPG